MRLENQQGDNDDTATNGFRMQVRGVNIIRRPIKRKAADGLWSISWITFRVIPHGSTVQSHLPNYSSVQDHYSWRRCVCILTNVVARAVSINI